MPSATAEMTSVSTVASSPTIGASRIADAAERMPASVKLVSSTTVGDHPDEAALYRFATRRIPAHATVAVEPIFFPVRKGARNLHPFPFFGAHLSRHLVLTTSSAAAAAKGATWAILPNPQCTSGWRVAFRYGVWRVLERSAGAACS